MSTFQSAVRSLTSVYMQGPATVVPVTASTLTLSPSAHGGRIMSIQAASTTITLPAVNATAFSPTTGPGQDPNTQNNFGVMYTFFLPTAATAVKILAPTGNFLIGSVGLAANTGSPTVFVADGSTIRSINLNGTTTGGLPGSYIDIVAFAANTYMIQANLIGSGTLATPLATS